MQSCFGPLSLLDNNGPVVKAVQQPSRLAVLQDLNPYFIKQIARSLQEFDLEQKIDLEIKMHEGTTKLLAACRHPSQSLEAAKTLLTSQERMAAYLAELQKRKSETSMPKTTSTEYAASRPCLAKVSVTDIRMPLIWKDTDHFKNKGDYRRFAVFCLLKIGTEIFDTTMIGKVDRSMTDISFEDVIIFNQIPHCFEFKLEVYAHILQDDLSIASTPHKIKHHINDSLSRKVGRKLAASMKDELAAAEVGPKFELVAKATLWLENVDNNICTHDLHIENHESPSTQLPLFGHFCCRLAAQPEFLAAERLCGPLTVQTNDNGSTSHLWGVLKGTKLNLWDTSDQARCPAEPKLSISVSKESTISINETEGLTESQIIITNPCEAEDVVHYVAAKDEETTSMWFSALFNTVLSHGSWKHAAETVMHIPMPAADRLSLFSRFRKGSLYDRTPLKDSPITSGQIGSFATTGASPVLHRSRSSSLISSTSSSGSSARPLLPTTKQTRASQRFSCHETCV